MKILRYLLILVVILVVAVLAIGLIEPNDVTVVRSTTINAPKDVVFEQIVKFKNWTNWSPWYKKDPTMKMTYLGTDGEPGSSYTWEGKTNETGAGEMKNDAVKDGEMDYTVTFTKPRSGSATGFLKAESVSPTQTKASWTCKMHFSYPMNALLFMNMEKMMGPDFESGLADMKKYAETHNTPTVAIQEVQFAEHNYAGMRKIVNWKDLSQYFMDSYGALGKEAGARINGPAVGIYYTWDTVNHSTDMVAAFPVADTSKPVKGAKFVHVGACKAYMVAYTGVYSGMTNVHMALNKKLAEKGQKMAGVIEEYMRGPHEDQDSTKWVTNIYYLVQ